MKKYILAVLLLLSICTLLNYGCKNTDEDADERFNITFVIDNETYTVQNYKFGSLISPPEINEREDYIFNGWYLTDKYLDKWDFENVVKDNIYLYGFWTKTTSDYFRVYFYDNLSLLCTQDISSGSKIEEFTPQAKEGYEFSYWEYGGEPFNVDTQIYNNLALKAIFKPIRYTVKFLADEKVIKELTYTVESKEIICPTVPPKQYYSGKWEKFTLTTGNIEVRAMYSPDIYTATFIINDIVYKKINYSIEDDLTEVPIPEKSGYTGEWIGLSAPIGDITVTAKYEPIIYTINFMLYSELFKSVEYNVEDEIILPEIPDIPMGYRGVWEAFEPASQPVINLNVCYYPIQYQATFVVDSEIIAVRYFTIEDIEVNEPPVPEKDGIIGSWEQYELKLENIIIKAVY